MKRPRLVPLVVPWEVSPSTPFLRLHVEECGDPIRVSLVAHFALYDGPNDVHDGRSVEIVIPPDESLEEQGEKVGPYQLVVVSFKSGVAAKWLPAYSDDDAINEKAYDQTAFSCPYREGDDPHEWMQRFQEHWMSTGFCPDPGLYEVQESQWREEVGAAGKHYLIRGHDAYLEILADDWSWESKRVLRDW